MMSPMTWNLKNLLFLAVELTEKNHIYLQLCIYSSYLNLTPIGDMAIETTGIQVGVKHFKNLIKKKKKFSILEHLN